MVTIEYDPNDLEPGDVAAVEHFCDCENCEGHHTHIGLTIILEKEGEFIQPSISVGPESDLTAVPYKHKYRTVEKRLLDHEDRELRLLWVSKGTAKARVNEYERIVQGAQDFEKSLLAGDDYETTKRILETGFASEHLQAIKVILEDDRLPTSISKTHAIIKALRIEATNQQVVGIMLYLSETAVMAAPSILANILAEHSSGFDIFAEHCP